MAHKINPFHELYVTESIGPEAFVRLFSDTLVSHTSPLFKPGNVVLKGLPGTGKSMMLNLLKPSIRIAYKNCKLPFPIPKEFRKFIGAGINLIRSSVSDFGQRPINDNATDLNELALYFGDFLNYWVVRDILTSVLDLGKVLSNEIGIDISLPKLDLFASMLKADDVWFGYLDHVNSFTDLENTLKQRIISYRSYLNYNSDSLPQSLVNSKTAIGSPILATAHYLRKSKVINDDVQIFVRIDQYEELAWLDQSIPGLGEKYQSVVHKLLAMRDASVSYRIGTRPFAWSDTHKSVLGTSAAIEQNRNYISISIDEVLRRPENTKTYIFPKFAEDIFRKRLGESRYTITPETNSVLKEVFGKGIDPEYKALMYVTQSKDRVVDIDDEWPLPWKDFLIQLAQTDPLSARLGEAWCRQRGKGDVMYNIPTQKPYPWEEKKYWRKERVEQALIQIASRNRQHLIWEGREDILQLSGGNILAFLSLCQQIWEVWMRDTKSLQDDYSLPKLDHVIQNLGILEASARWYENISNEKGGKNRKLFITYLGSKIYKKLVDDSKMSYPGNNGFSLDIKELEKVKYIEIFLKEASDYGDLQENRHTTKNKKGEERIKWYLNPILSPRFRIPASHTKEPIYLSISELNSWLIESSVLKDNDYSKLRLITKKKRKEDPRQGTLFD